MIPRLEVVSANGRRLDDHLAHRAHKCGVEVEQDVREKDHVHNRVDQDDVVHALNNVK